jgi:6-phosphogluconolactonase
MKPNGATDSTFPSFVLWAVLGAILLATCGGGDGGEGPLPPPPPPPMAFAYVANFRDNSVSQYAIGADGSLTALSPPTVVAGDYPYAIAVDPGGKFAYVANSSDVSQYTIGMDGSLIPMSPATVPAGTSINHITVDPGGRFAYVVNWADDNVSPATVAAGSFPAFIAIDPTGRFAYVANYTGAPILGNVSQYTIAADGKLEPMSPATVAAGWGPNAIAVDPTGRFAYVANALQYSANRSSTNNISQYTIGADGKLTPMSPPTVGAGQQPYSVWVDPSGRFVYVANYWGDTVSQYTIGADGKLTPMTPAAVAAGNGPYCVTVDPTGRFVFATNISDNSVSQYTIGTDGNLVAMFPATIMAGDGPAFITTIVKP